MSLAISATRAPSIYVRLELMVRPLVWHRYRYQWIGLTATSSITSVQAFVHQAITVRRGRLRLLLHRVLRDTTARLRDWRQHTALALVRLAITAPLAPLLLSSVGQAHSATEQASAGLFHSHRTVLSTQQL